MSPMASQITSITIVYSTVYSGADQRKHQRSASPAFVHKGPVTGKMSSFDDVIMYDEDVQYVYYDTDFMQWWLVCRLEYLSF